MNNFIFSYPTKVYFGKSCVKEHLCCLLKQQRPTVLLAYGGGSIKKTGIYEPGKVKITAAMERAYAMGKGA